MVRHPVKYLEFMITTTCNLSCEGCDRFIEYNHNWTADYEQIIAEIKNWSRRLKPKNVALLGGEPLIHPEFYNILRETRKNFKNSRIEIFTNGLLLHNKEKLIEVCHEVGNVKILVSIHNRQKNIRNYILKNVVDYLVKDYDWEKIEDRENYYKHKDVKFEILDHTRESNWVSYRKKVNGKLKPWNQGYPNLSYDNCVVKHIPIIYKNRLYKCPPISLVRTHLEKFKLENDPDWEPYYKYKGLGLDCSEDEMQNFIDNIYKPQSICNMCPVNPSGNNQPEAFLKHKLKAR